MSKSITGSGKPPTVAIIGAGVGGLAAGIRLAAQGCQVFVFERNRCAGGKLNIIQADGWTFDTGPSLLTMPDVARELFAVTGASLDDELDLLPLDPICRYTYPDGIVFDASADMERMMAAMEEFSGRDAANFPKFLDYGRRVFDITAQPFLYSALGAPGKVARQFARRLNQPLDLARVMAPLTLDSLVSSYFRDPHLRQLFNRYATYNGSSPYQTPAVYSVIPYIEHRFGAWYPRGGMYQIATALTKQLARAGGELYVDRPVREVRCELAGSGARVTGVELVDGTIVPADVVISNVDVTTTYRRLIPPAFRARPTLERLAKLEPSLSGFVLLLGLDRKYEQLQHHNIFFAQDYRQEFADIFTRLVAPRDPTIYVCASSRTDPSQAPAGHENLFVLVNAPYLSDEFSWEAHRDSYRDLVLEKLERMGLRNLRQHIVFERMLTPEDLQATYGAHRGAIYGYSSNHRFAPFTRPHNRATDIKGLYFAGGSAHPGGGLPLVMLSGKIVAELVMDDAQVV